jgi:Rrf2 family protein
MRISAKIDYACKAILELAINWPNDEPVQLKVISKNQDIPMRYLVQILIQLKGMGLVDSIRGKEGGYNLTKAPAEITLGEVIRGIGGPLLPVANTIKKRESVFERIWDEVEGAIGMVLDKVTFEDICKKVVDGEKALFYSI